MSQSTDRTTSACFATATLIAAARPLPCNRNHTYLAGDRRFGSAQDLPRQHQNHRSTAANVVLIAVLTAELRRSPRLPSIASAAKSP